MTRETKLGLGVATSFLTLAAVVAYHTWYKNEALPPAPEAPPPAGIAQLSPTKKKDNKPQPSILPASYDGMPAAPSGSGAPAILQGLPIDNPQPPSSQQLSPPMPHVPSQPNDPVPPIGGGPTPPPAQQTPKQDSINFPPLQKEYVSPGFDQPKTPAGPSNNIPTVPPATDQLARGPGTNDVKIDGGLPIGGQPPMTSQPQPGVPIPPPSPLGVAPGVVAGPGSQVQIPPNPLPATGVPNPAIQGNPNSITPVAPPINPLDQKQAAPGLIQKQPLGPVDQKPIVPVQPPDTGIPGGSPNPPNAVTPGGFVPQPGAVTKPQVESFDERRYVVQPTDADFAAISKQAYNSDKYANALIAFNRDHPIGKMSVQQLPHVIPGTDVYIPPIHVLETKYAALVANGQPALQEGSKAPAVSPSGPPKAMVPIGSTPSTGSPVTPINPGLPAGAPPAVAPWNGPQAPGAPQQPIQPKDAVKMPPPSAAINPQAAPGVVTNVQYKLYVVPQGGQQFYEIARETLGSPNRWSEIYQLNQQFNPADVVPAGSQMRLPADARVGQ